MELKNGMPTNKYYVIDKANNIKIHDTNINFNSKQRSSVLYPKFELKSNQRIALQNDFCLIIDDFEHTIRRIQYVTTNGEFESLNEVYIDIETNEQFTEAQILDAFVK